MNRLILTLSLKAPRFVLEWSREHFSNCSRIWTLQNHFWDREIEGIEKWNRKKNIVTVGLRLLSAILMYSQLSYVSLFQRLFSSKFLNLNNYHDHLLIDFGISLKFIFVHNLFHDFSFRKHSFFMYLSVFGFFSQQICQQIMWLHWLFSSGISKRVNLKMNRCLCVKVQEWGKVEREYVCECKNMWVRWWG